ncbi:hypothetical protein PNEG_02100 [Pneumocystis murina B123]|uniref:CCAAT-binding factor domain-containing protein n=1 Tax=Pneumocystis murina (strain B123) TaxID=1069680 RepID=M7NQG7_PNEMU|nr:hypothetical protein PNEG_02100 [Pneumocystis murina B123]EMR09512.1 hypothetical protein PNEG_02100 [Pneumocystis murina B123]
MYKQDLDKDERLRQEKVFFSKKEVNKKNLNLMDQIISNEMQTGNKFNADKKRIKRHYLHKKNNISIMKDQNKVEKFKKKSKAEKILNKKVKKGYGFCEKEEDGVSKNNEKKNKQKDFIEKLETDLTVSTATDKEVFCYQKKLTFEPKIEWHLEELPIISSVKIGDSLAEKLYIQAKKYHEIEEEKYVRFSHKSSSNKHFFDNIMKFGTLSDRISALTLSIQESPLHSSKKMRMLLNMTKKKSRTESLQSVEALKDLFISTVLPNRKLKYFKQQESLGSKDVTKKHLILWAFEDFLKYYYFEYLQVIESLLKNSLSFLRERMVVCVFELIREKPEQEQNLLKLLVNKLGDPEKKVASKTSYCILKLTIVHPAMKEVIISEIEQFLFCPSTSRHAQYYAIITLNQMVLSKKTNIATYLINIYFLFFTKLTKLLQNENATKKVKSYKIPWKTKDILKKNKSDNDIYEKEINSKLVLAIISGINRAFPFSKIDDGVFESHVNSLFVIVHGINFNTSIQALILIFQISRFKQTILDRFYKTLYESIQDFRLFNSSKQIMYLNLLFKAIKADTDKTRVKSFVKRLIQYSNMHQITFICGIMILLNELEKIHPEIKSLYNRYEKVYNKKRNSLINILNGDKNVLSVKNNNVSILQDSLNKYDGYKRDPRYSNADNSYLWELIPFLNHFHPTISSFAKSLLYGYRISSKPNLSLFTLSHFLNKFVYKNPKTKIIFRGNSIMQPISKQNRNMFFLTKSDTFSHSPLNKESFVKQKIDQVSPDEIFYFRYFSQKQIINDRKKSTKAKVTSSDNESNVFEDSESIEDISDENLSEDTYDQSDIGDEGYDENDIDFNESENDLVDDEFIDKELSTISIGSKRKLNEKSNYVKGKKLKQLPVFASVNEYSAMLES